MLALKPGRIPCEVLSCGRTAPADKYPPRTIICCGKCWRLADKALRLRWRGARRERERLEIGATKLEDGGLSFPSKGEYLDHTHMLSEERRIWDQIIAQANEARAGIG